MKKCAKCDFEYDESYDGCPVCARTATSPPVPATGSLIGGLLAFLGFLFLAGFLGALSGGSIGAFIALAIFAIVVTVDSYQIVKADRKVDGLLGTHPLVWGACVLLLAIVGIPLYFYERPRIVAAYS